MSSLMPYLTYNENISPYEYVFEKKLPISLEVVNQKPVDIDFDIADADNYEPIKDREGNIIEGIFTETPKEIEISEVDRIKVVINKFSRYKDHNIVTFLREVIPLMSPSTLTAFIIEVFTQKNYMTGKVSERFSISKAKFVNVTERLLLSINCIPSNEFISKASNELYSDIVIKTFKSMNANVSNVSISKDTKNILSSINNYYVLAKWSTSSINTQLLTIRTILELVVNNNLKFDVKITESSFANDIIAAYHETKQKAKSNATPKKVVTKVVSKVIDDDDYDDEHDHYYE